MKLFLQLFAKMQIKSRSYLKIELKIVEELLPIKQIAFMSSQRNKKKAD